MGAVQLRSPASGRAIDMKLLLYCIFEAHGVALPEKWEGQVEFLRAHGLGVAFSRCESVVSPPPIESLLAYDRVVTWLHARCCIIPLRYGNIADSEASVVELLAWRAQEFRELLARLDGKTEIGLRVLLAHPPANSPAVSKPAAGLTPGTVYLNSIRQRLERDRGLNEVESGLVERILDLVRDLNADLASELRRAPENRLLSIFLLLPKENVDECRRRLAPFLQDPSVKALVTGPWPPYNSVASQEAAHV